MLSPRPRILIVQDDARSGRFQVSLLERILKERGIDAEIVEWDLEQPTDELLQGLRDGSDWYDWMVTDLLGRDEHEWRDCSGVQLLRTLHHAGLVGGYHRRVQPPRGVRNIAVCSVCVDNGTSTVPGLVEELERLGVRSQWLGRGGDPKQLFTRIADELERDAEPA